MKTGLRQEQGSFLITAAVAAGILAILVVGYLTWVTNEVNLNYRSQGWTQALNLCEAGLELGMAELNYPYRYQGPAYAFQSSSGWVANGSYQYTKSVSSFTNAAGATIGSFSVTVANLNAQCPTITCTGICTAARGPGITRIVKVVVTKPSAIRYALTAKSWIKQNGANAS